jgi:hypothetical protein
LNDIDALIDKYGDTMPDAWHPGMPAVPGTMGPEPTALFAARQDYAAALERHGYTEKAAGIRETYNLGPMPTATRQ